MFCAQTGPVLGGACYSSARRAPFAHRLGRPFGAVPRAERRDQPPRNRCSRSRCARARALVPINNGNSPRGGPPNSKRRLAAWRGPAPPRPKPVLLSSAPRTRVRPVPRPGSRPEAGAARCCGEEEERLLFFKPARDGGARHTEGATQTAQTGAFLLGAPEELALLCGITVRARIRRRAPSAGAAQRTLAAIGGRAVAHELWALTMRTGNNQSDHPGGNVSV